MKEATFENLDDLDLMLIKELEIDGRQTNTDLAKKIGTSKATARRKLRRLLDENIIRVVAVANPPALGYKTVATMGINVRPGEVDAVAEKLAAYKNIHFVIISTGRYDIIAWVMFREPEDLSNFLRKELGKIPGLTSVETMVNLKIIKASFSYLSGEDYHFPED
ncbi:MAG: Lrp/AsnC family transcriptional regulator [Chloroflexi bacterium]|nr:Lrp/AsnC family transcriptional regulator [Chloroflexota bacterium]